MRADRLIAILLMLQRSDRISAAAIARELEVSRRTVMRDLEALGAAGVPIYSVRGRNGGYELWEGFRTQITGLTADEVRSLPFFGLPDHARLFSLDDARLRLRQKMAMNLPAEMEGDLEWIETRFLYDPVGLGALASREVAVLAKAIETQRVVVIGSDGAAAYPLGLVDNAGTWYLVADLGSERRVIDVGSLGSVRTTGRRFHRPPDFDVRREWERFRATRPNAANRSSSS